MGSHEEFLELCAAATAGELSADEQAKLDAHLAVCPECRQAMKEYREAARTALAALARESAPNRDTDSDSWSVDEAEKEFFKRLDREQKEPPSAAPEGNPSDGAVAGRRFAYRPSQIHWREVWMPFAAAILLAVALGITAYKTGVKSGTDIARSEAPPVKGSDTSLEAQVSDTGYAHARLEEKLAEDAVIINDLKRQLSEQSKIVTALRSADSASRLRERDKEGSQKAGDSELLAAQTKLAELQKTVDAAMAQRDENAREAASLEAKVNELTQLVRDRELALDRKDAEVAKGQELLEHDRDIRELMGARELYMADVHDVSGKGTDKTYGRVFYTKGKSLIFYAFDLDAKPGVQNARSFQAWGRKGPDREQARSLGIFYEDNASKKRWVLKADDPKTLEDIDAVFVTVEPHGGSQHPSGKQLLFAYLRVSPNHP